METAAKKLEILFGEAEQQLNVLSTKVDTQCRLLEQNTASTDASPTDLPSSASISSVVGCVKTLRTELHKVAEDVAVLQQQQQQVMQSIQCELLALSETLSSVPDQGLHCATALPATSC